MKTLELSSTTRDFLEKTVKKAAEDLRRDFAVCELDEMKLTLSINRDERNKISSRYELQLIQSTNITISGDVELKERDF